jgi:hypothetical protein
MMRRALANDVSMTYAATTRNIVSAIRKLSHVGHPDLKEGGFVFRGIAGVLPESFWLKDDAGVVCATDLGFMRYASTWYAARHGMPHGTVSRAARYPARRSRYAAVHDLCSTSLGEETPIHYMQAGAPNLLWKVNPNLSGKPCRRGSPSPCGIPRSVRASAHTLTQRDWARRATSAPGLKSPLPLLLTCDLSFQIRVLHEDATGFYCGAVRCIL